MQEKIFSKMFIVFKVMSVLRLIDHLVNLQEGQGYHISVISLNIF